MFAYLLVTLLNGPPAEVRESTLRAAVEHMHQHLPAMRRITGPLLFDLRTTPRITFGMTRPALENMVGIVSGSEFDFSYPVHFTHSFHPLAGITRVSRHEVEFDTRYHAPDGDFTHAYRWIETRTYWLDVRPFPPVALVQSRIFHFNEELPEPKPGLPAPYPAELMWNERDDPDMAKYMAARAAWKKESEARYEERNRNPLPKSRIPGALPD